MKSMSVRALMLGIAGLGPRGDGADFHEPETESLPDRQQFGALVQALEDVGLRDRLLARRAREHRAGAVVEVDFGDHRQPDAQRVLDRGDAIRAKFTGSTSPRTMIT